MVLRSGITQNLRNLKRKSAAGQLILMLLGAELLFFSAFVSLRLPTATKLNLERFVEYKVASAASSLPERWQPFVQEVFPAAQQPEEESVRYSSYVALIPMAVALGYILGFPLAIMSIAGFLLLGTVGPYLGFFAFTAGGGMDYWKEPGFGYLVGIIAGALFSSWLNPDERKSWRQVLGALGATLIVHLCGLAYLVGSSLLILIFEGRGAYLAWQPWLSEQIRNLSWYPLPYDLLFSLLLIGAGFPLRWLVNILTAPDIASRYRPRLTAQMEVFSDSRV